jgi:hypothetical protein
MLVKRFWRELGKKVNFPPVMIRRSLQDTGKRRFRRQGVRAIPVNGLTKVAFETIFEAAG